MAETKSPQSEQKAELTARVVLPEAESDEEDVDHTEQNAEDVQDGDILEDFPDNTEEIDLVHSRLSSLSELRLPRFANHLTKLCLRQNFISNLDDDIFHPLVNLEELDLYDNKVKHVGTALDKCQSLVTLDLSFNLIKSIPDALEHLSVLRTVYFVQNRISKISGLHKSINLTSLELGGNKIREIENLDSLVNLEELWLGKNKITKLENLDHLKKLKILSIQSNRITKIEGLENLECLEQLYLSHNGIKKLEGLKNNTRLNTLDIGTNFVSVVENLSHLTMLQELWMNGNQIPDLNALESQLGHIQCLTTIYMEGNPCQTNDMAGYRRKIILALKQVTQIDATFVRV